MSDQIMALEKDLEKLQKELGNVNEDRARAEFQAKSLRLKCERLQNEREINQTELSAVSDQIELQKSRIRSL